MTRFEADIRSQGALLGELLRASLQDDVLDRASSLCSPHRPVVFVGMGSSLAAARPVAARLAAEGQWSVAAEAGELLHYGLSALTAGSTVILVSQSGRSAETLAVAQRLRSVGGVRLIAVVNDLASPLAQVADLVAPMRAGSEVVVSTRTFIATYIVLSGLADAISGRSGETAKLALDADLSAEVSALACDPELTRISAVRLAKAHALAVLGRGPGFAAAEYGALILKEAAAVAAEAMFAGSFRHGPIEIVGPATGVIVLAPNGQTQSLCVQLARDAARFGSPTWLLTAHRGGPQADAGRSSADDLITTELPEVPEILAPLLYCVPLQHLAVQLAKLRNREPGVVERSSKVTISE